MEYQHKGENEKYVSFGQNVFTLNFRKDSKNRGLKDYSLLQTKREKGKLCPKKEEENETKMCKKTTNKSTFQLNI